MSSEEIYQKLDYENRLKTLIDIRKSKGVTQAQVAKELNVTPAAVCRVEKFERRSFAWLALYERLFGGDAS